MLNLVLSNKKTFFSEMSQNTVLIPKIHPLIFFASLL